MSNNKDERTPLFSVVIPLYNKADTILRTLKSVQNQVFKDFELIVVDDGSKDGGAAVVEQFGSQFPVKLIRQPNQGVSAARNAGSRAARGRFIAYLDGDDELYPEFLQEMKKIVDLYPEAQVMGSNYEFCGLRGLSSGLCRKRIDSVNIFREWVFRIPLNSSSMVVSKIAFTDVGGYDSTLHYFEDAEFLFRLGEKYDFFISRRVLSRYNGDARERAASSNRNVNLVESLPHWKFLDDKLRNGHATAEMRYCAQWLFLHQAAINYRHHHVGDTLLLRKGFETIYRVMPFKMLAEDLSRTVWRSVISLCVCLYWRVRYEKRMSHFLQIF